MLNLLKKSSTRKIVENGYTFLLISHISELQTVDLDYLDGLIIDTDSQSNAYDIVSKIRTHKKIHISLLPLFVNSVYTLSNETMIHTDGSMEISLVASYIQKVIAIQKRIKQINVPNFLSHNLTIQFKTVAFSYSRNNTLEPIPSRNSFIGYKFPVISLFYKQSEELSLLKNLETAVKQNYLSIALKDYVHLCKGCSSNYLNFRECCPKCDSIDINSHDIVHHFVCANVAPEKDYKKEDRLECPKCDKELRHIGIDYDKPSSIYSCNSCSHEFQNANMQALCLDCSNDNKLEELIEKTIGSYRVTEIGESFLIDNDSSVVTKKDANNPGNNLNANFFKLLVNQEIKRIKETNGESYFAKIHFENHQLELLNKDLQEKLSIEISGIINSYLKQSDLLSAESYNTYYVLLPATTENQLERLENIQYNLSKLVSDNLSNTSQEISISIHKIDGSDNYQRYFE